MKVLLIDPVGGGERARKRETDLLREPDRSPLVDAGEAAAGTGDRWRRSYVSHAWLMLDGELYFDDPEQHGFVETLCFPDARDRARG